MSITKTEIANILHGKPPKEPYKLADGLGLYLYITPTAQLWRYDYRLKRPGQPDDGKRKTLSIGKYGAAPDRLDLDAARHKHLAARKIVQNGGDPAADLATSKKIGARVRNARKHAARLLTLKTVRGYAKAAPEDTGPPGEEGSFGFAADGWNALMQKRASAGKRSATTRAHDVRMVRYLNNSFGRVALEDIEVPHLVKLLDVFEGANKYTTRQRLQSATVRIMGFAQGKGWVKTNPFLGVSFGHAYTAPPDAPRPAIIAIQPFGKLLRDVASYDGRRGNQIGDALKLLSLTFVRPGNVVAAEWSEFDLDDEMMWTIPFQKLKQRTFREGVKELKDRPHYVPLSRQAVALLRELQTLTGHGTYLFPNAESLTGHITTEGLGCALNDLGYKGVHCPHGFRSSASTLLNAERIVVEGNELERFPERVIEFQLEHVDKSIAAIYNRNQRLPERIKMMQFWADKCDAIRDGKVTGNKLRIVA
jgi:integrase